MADVNQLLSVAEAAQFLKLSPQAVRNLIKSQKLQAEQIGSHFFTTNQYLQAYLQRFSVIIEPDDHERHGADLPEIVALSFFSGAMGLDLGMRQGGIHALLACDNNKYCRMTIAHNAPEMALLGDITKYSAAEILRMAKIPDSRKVDVIFGGPPCQAFSTAGARRGLEDSRGNLFLSYLELIAQIKPTYIVLENVRGLLSSPYPYGPCSEPVKGGTLCVILDQLKAAGYTVSFNLYNAANFGAPQIRERLVIIGKLGPQPVAHLTPNHAEHGEFKLPVWRTFADACAGLSESEQHFVTFPEKRLKFYRMLKPGQYWKDLPPEMQIEAMGAKLKLGGGKTGFYRRLSWDRPAPTLVTDPTMPATDLCHPEADRPLSIEEYARIQGFPDDWKICGPLKEQYRQIGNAVPVALGQAIAQTIKADMQGVVLPQYPEFKHSRYKLTDELSWSAHMQKVFAKHQAG